MTDRIYNVLFLCTGNSARSIMAEAILNQDGRGHFKAFSAGSQPKGQPHPMALEVLESLGFTTDGLRSKSWKEFAEPSSPELDLIITVCDNAAGESCPVWPGKPITAHWGIEDPAAVEGPGQRDAFVTALRYLRTRISLLLALPLESIEEMTLREKLKSIGRSEGATSASEEAL
jgi:arsenate reductase